MSKKVMTRKRGNWWSYRFEGATVDGKRQWITRSGFHTKKEAYDAGIAAYQEYQSSGLKLTPTELSVADFMDYWLKEYCEVNLKETTVLNYRKKVKNIIKPHIGKYRLRSIQTATIQKMIYDLFQSGYARNTLTVVKGILTKSFAYAKANHFIKDNPMCEVELPRSTAKPNVKSRRKERSYIPKERIAEIFQRFLEGSSTYLPLLLGYRCGLRLGEAYALQWKDIDFQKKTLTVQRQIQYVEKKIDTFQKSVLYFSEPKYNSFRTIQLDSETLGVLERLKSQQKSNREEYAEFYCRYFETPERTAASDPEPHILNTDGIGEEIFFLNVNADGSYIRPRTMQHASYVIHTELDFPEFDFHSLRHTHCTELLEAGFSPKAVQMRLGHKDIKTTLNIYEHITQSQEDKAAMILEDMYSSD